MLKTTKICSSHYVVSNGEREFSISLDVDEVRCVWKAYCEDLEFSEFTFATKDEAFDFVTDLLS